MTEYERQLILRVADGDQECLKIVIHPLTAFEHFEEHLRWFLKSNLTGKTLREWKVQKFGFEVLSLYQFLRQKIRKNKEVMPVVLGHDYKCGVRSDS